MMLGFWSLQWSVTRRSPEEIRDAALAEIRKVSLFAADLSNGANGAVGSFGSYGILA